MTQPTTPASEGAMDVDQLIKQRNYRDVIEFITIASAGEKQVFIDEVANAMAEEIRSAHALGVTEGRALERERIWSEIESFDRPPSYDDLYKVITLPQEEQK